MKIRKINPKNPKKSVKSWYKKDKSVECRKIYFSTDTSMAAIDILKRYKPRFQIEFLYRAANQFTGIEQCQIRSRGKIDFHVNASLTTVSLARASHRA